ncbi:1-(5-phosphoribosyl)-5-[(5-phosphoribosylamino)methylideneamino]imidazole-4-carboxamide isomerase [Christensenella tenuis]|uniref:1-(5-phosphoribosyl)-5-[(5-phosphoribosylamino)methylideneamino] imidazole-4-carboxamide isomerase n=1 Tax=Christensenella tenuis TaxID=2763033 RepID=A0ABR7ED33_9FIRM|nr:1-(5-phosphoribosyl)-5-[(5-phosphoribosylamino)methylideneamino]imidazole-4-carboxamide isomerase [Christensenella tenuis]MBC5647083.1 1-(5-phosphoribosyl)-5-[(5-phosphoribosylamino)methylideneamino]imidazole-4-carboxamide isomerase [Christensenella tenuis]
MKIYPAIDIRDGKCVRLMQGELQRSTEYGDPIEMAKRWEDEGAYYLHVVDLDAAFSGSFVNQEIITKLVQSIKIPVQMGGGVRTKEDIRVRLDDAGISRVILGTVAVENPELVKWAVARYKDRIAVGIDAKEGRVAIKGWAEDSDMDPVSLAKDMHAMGVANIIYTDISKDGMMEGPNLEKTEMIVKKTWMNLIASGGISSLDDIRKVRETGACGCIVGRALYDGAFTLQDAMKAAK